MFKLFKFFLILLILFFVIQTKADGQWSHSSGNTQSHRYSKEIQINKSNVNNLEVAWIYKTKSVDAKNTVQSTPIYYNKKLFLSDIRGGLHSINPGTGKGIWKKTFAPPVARRGISSGKIITNNIFVPTRNGVVSLNALDGSVVRIYKSGLSLLAPIIHDDKIFVATLKKGIKAFDLNTGTLKWTFNLKKNNVNPRVWSGFSFDPVTKLIFFVTSNPGGLYGGSRNNEDNSVSTFAIDIEGKKKMEFSAYKT